MRRLIATAALVTLVGLAACGGQGDDDSAGDGNEAGAPTTEAPAADEAPPCDEVFVDGATITAEQWQAGCTQDGTLVTAMSYGYDCGTAWQSDLGWGYEGQAFHAGQPLPGLEVISVCGQP